MYLLVLHRKVVTDQEWSLDWSRPGLVLNCIWMFVRQQPGVIAFARLGGRDILQIDLHAIGDTLGCAVLVLSTACVKCTTDVITCRCWWSMVVEEKICSQCSGKKYDDQNWNQDSVQSVSASSSCRWRCRRCRWRGRCRGACWWRWSGVDHYRRKIGVGR